MNCPLADDILLADADGDLGAGDAASVRRHVDECASCHRRLAQLRRSDALLREAAQVDVPAGLLRRVRGAVADDTGLGKASDVMTLEETSAFLRLSLADMDELVDQLPVFELAGRLRIRRSRLLEWIAQRERAQSQAWLSGELNRQLANGGA